MSGAAIQRTIRNSALAGTLVLGAQTASAGTAMTAGTVLDKMSTDERFSYVAGMIDGLAHARLQKDTLAKGVAEQEGMNCIYRWFYQGDGKAHAVVSAAFGKYRDHYPATIIAVLIKRECGE